MSRTFEATTQELSNILKYTRSQIELTTLNAADINRVQLALEEGIVNVITHGAYKGNVELTIICRLERNNTIEFELQDTGPAFNPLIHEGVDTTQASLQEREPGGLGILLMKKCMDALTYRREGDLNILTLVKNIGTHKL